jgi:hypothetical protein
LILNDEKSSLTCQERVGAWTSASSAPSRTYCAEECKFSDKESSKAGKQMAVRRAREKAASGKRIPPPPNVIDTSTVGVSTVSPITGANSTRSLVAIVTATAAAMTATRWRRNDATTNQ